MASKDEFPPAFLRGKSPPRELPDQDDDEAEPGRPSPRVVLSVTFVDGQGLPYQFGYGFLYRVWVEGRALQVEFSDHVVTVEGTGLFAPLKDCLMRRIGHHKTEFVQVHPRPEFAEGEVVTAVTVAKKG